MQLTSVELERTPDRLVANLTIPGGLLTATVAAELASAASSLVEDRDIRVVTLMARDGDFCLGPAADLDPYQLRPDPASALARLRPPVIVAVDGACRAEGLEVALAADLRIGTPDSTYALDHVVDGRVPAWGGTQRLPRAINPGAAIALALLGEPLGAAEANVAGLLYRVTDSLTDELAALVAALAGRGPLATEFTKEAVHRGSELPLRDGLRLEGDLNHQLAASEDRAEGLAAFFEKRPPDFSGR